MPEGGSHSNKADALTLGKPKGAFKPETTNFKKKGTGTIVLGDGNISIIFNTLSIASKYHYGDDYKKAPVPKKDEKPIMGLVSDKNYVVANAVENILAGKLFYKLYF